MKTCVPWGPALLALLVLSCGGAQAQPKSECPSGTYLQDGNCLPLSDQQQEKAMQGPAPSDATGTGAGPGASAGAGSSAGTPTPYDKEAVQIELRRAGLQAGRNCGSATDEEGKASGPFGKLTVTVTLGQNGHVKGVSVPPPFGGKPVGKCIEQAFTRFSYPPYVADTDATADWEVDVHPPKGK